MKRCSVCHLDLPRAAFDPDVRLVTGLRSECRECGRKRSREAMRRRWAEQHEKMVESNNRSYAKHRDKRMASRRAYHAAHREQAKEYQKVYREVNRIQLKVRVLDSVARRRARLKGVHVEPVSRLAVFERDEWRCWLCEEAVDPAALGGRRPSLDHVVPICQGGEHSMANVKLAHLSCNQGRPKH